MLRAHTSHSCARAGDCNTVHADDVQQRVHACVRTSHGCRASARVQHRGMQCRHTSCSLIKRGARSLRMTASTVRAHVTISATALKTLEQSRLSSLALTSAARWVRPCTQQRFSTDSWHLSFATCAASPSHSPVVRPAHQQLSHSSLCAVLTYTLASTSAVVQGP